MKTIIKRPTVFLLTILVPFWLFIFLTYKDFGISWDEEADYKSGQFYLENFLAPPNVVSQNVSVIHQLSHGALTDMIYFLPQKIFNPTDFYEVLHLTKALASSLTIVFIFLALQLITKSKPVSLAGAILIIFFPRWLGDIFDNHMDATATIFYALEILLAVKILTTAELKSKLNWLIGLAVFAGISFSHRPALITVPFITIPLTAWQMRNLKVTWSKMLTSLFLFVLIFYISLYMVDPYTRAYGPISIISKLTSSANFTYYVGAQLFAGEYYYAKDFPAAYLPVWILITTPIITLLFFILGTFALIKNLFSKTRQPKLISLLLLSAFFGPLFLVVILRPIFYNAWRHLLFLSAPLVIIAAVGFGQLIQKRFNFLKTLAITALILNVLFTSKAYWQLHPYQYLYFNSLVGGLQNAYHYYETDYWAKTNKDAVSYLRQNVLDPTKTYKIGLCASEITSLYYFSANMVWERKKQNADYLICVTRLSAHELVTNPNTIYVVKRQDAPLNYIEKVKKQ